MRIAYFDCFAGISGEMMLGALLSAGLSPDALRAMLSALHVGDYSLDIEPVTRAGLGATLFRVLTRNGPGGRASHRPHVNGNSNGNGAANGTHRGGRPNGHSFPVTAPDVERIVMDSTLPNVIKSTTLAVLRKLSDAEAAVYHGQAPYPSHASSREALVTIVAVAAGLLLLSTRLGQCSAAAAPPRPPRW